MSSPGTRTERTGGLILKVAGYSAPRASAEALIGLRGILLATLLGPAAFGSWALLRRGTRAGMGIHLLLVLPLLPRCLDEWRRLEAER